MQSFLLHQPPRGNLGRCLWVAFAFGTRRFRFNSSLYKSDFLTVCHCLNPFSATSDGLDWVRLQHTREGEHEILELKVLVHSRVNGTVSETGGRCQPRIMYESDSA
jgi:hypothetical protein